MAKIYVTDGAHQADVQAFEVDREHQADLLVFVEKYQQNAKGDEEWFFVDHAHQADTKIYWVDQAHKADLEVFFVDQAHKAKWKKGHKLKGRL